VTVYVRVEDLHASVAQAEALGATIVMAPREVMTGIETAVITDPEGHMIGMIRGL
jgi:predicted enzyme related to lactoylglutathione lyase